MLPRRSLIFFAGLFASLCFTANGEPLRIVVAGDGRAEYQWNLKRSCDQDGINQTVTRAIVGAVLDEKAAILLWTGDMANVDNAELGTFRKRLGIWRGIMEPLYANKTKVWPVRGNHEVYRYPNPKNYDGELMLDANSVWREVFSGRYALPNNGPESETDLSFYSVEGSALIIGLDQYGGADQEPLPRKHSVNQPWLDQVLQQNKKPFIFVYGHEQAFMTGGRHADDDTLAADAVARNSFWQSLVNAGAIYFCGHDHFYDRMSVTRKWADSPRAIFQITAGTAGAPGYGAGPYSDSTFWKLERAAHFENVWGYVLVEVDGDKATITFKAASASNCGGTGQLVFEPKDRIVCDPSGCKAAPIQAP